VDGPWERALREQQKKLLSLISPATIIDPGLQRLLLRLHQHYFIPVCTVYAGVGNLLNQGLPASYELRRRKRHCGIAHTAANGPTGGSAGLFVPFRLLFFIIQSLKHNTRPRLNLSFPA
jgi:hypothetical protein